jgi:RNA polymerase-binding transcription factor DksA
VVDGAADEPIGVDDLDRLREAVEAARRRTVEQIAGLERSLAGIIDAAELTSTDDEHDPEGATIAYERAQVSALLRLAREDRAALDDSLTRIESGTARTCTECGGGIATARLLALPSTRTCINCAT